MDEAEQGVGAEGAVTGEGAEGSAGASGEPTEGSTGEAGAGAEQPELYTVNVGGRQQQVTLEDLTKGYMRQADYTRKTQELARERQEVSQMQALAAALERDPRTTLAALASALGVNLATQVPTAPQGEVEPLDLLASKFDSLSQQITAQQQAAQAAQQQAQQQAAFQAQIEREIADLKDLHGDFAEKELFQYAVDHGVVDLGTAFRAWQFDLAQAAKIAEQNRVVEAKRKAQVVSGGQNAAPGSLAPVTGQRMSLREAFAAALANPQ